MAADDEENDDFAAMEAELASVPAEAVVFPPPQDEEYDEIQEHTEEPAQTANDLEENPSVVEQQQQQQQSLDDELDDASLDDPIAPVVVDAAAERAAFKELEKRFGPANVALEDEDDEEDGGNDDDNDDDVYEAMMQKSSQRKAEQQQQQAAEVETALEISSTEPPTEPSHAAVAVKPTVVKATPPAPQKRQEEPPLTAEQYAERAEQRRRRKEERAQLEVEHGNDTALYLAIPKHEVSEQIATQVANDIAEYPKRAVNMAKVKQAITNDSAFPDTPMLHAFRNPKCHAFSVVTFEMGPPSPRDQLPRQREVTNGISMRLRERQERAERERRAREAEVERQTQLQQQRDQQRAMDAAATEERRKHHLEYLRQRVQAEQELQMQAREAEREAREAREQRRHEQVQSEIEFMRRMVHGRVAAEAAAKDGSESATVAEQPAPPTHERDQDDLAAVRARLERLQADAISRLEQQRAEALAEVDRETARLGHVATNIQRREIQRNFAARKRSINVEMQSRLSTAQIQQQRRDHLLAPVMYHKMVFSKILTVN